MFLFLLKKLEFSADLVGLLADVLNLLLDLENFSFEDGVVVGEELVLVEGGGVQHPHGGRHAGEVELVALVLLCQSFQLVFSDEVMHLSFAAGVGQLVEEGFELDKEGGTLVRVSSGGSTALN